MFINNQTISYRVPCIYARVFGHGTQFEPKISEDQPVYYLPHHAVIKADSLTTKTRVVFDASAVTTSELSLNDIMCRGPTVQHALVNIIILRFRLH